MQNDLIVVNKSTAIVGTQAIRSPDAIKKELNSRNFSLYFDVVSNPEFLKEGAAINDFMKPDRIVVGGNMKIQLIYEKN